MCLLADTIISLSSGYRGDFFRWNETGDGEFWLLYLRVCSFKAKTSMITWHRPTLCSIMAPPSSTTVITQHVLHKEKPRSVHLEHEGMKSTLQSLQTESRTTGSYLVPVLWCDASSAWCKYNLRMMLKEKWFVLLSLAPPCNEVRIPLYSIIFSPLMSHLSWYDTKASCKVLIRCLCTHSPHM